VQALERELGEVLFHRNTRNVRLSDAGRAFADRATVALDQVDALFGRGAEELSAATGLVRVTAPTMVGRRLLLPAVARLLSGNPGLFLDLRFTDEVVDPVALGIDVGVRAGRMGDNRQVARVVSSMSLCVCAAPGLLRGLPPVKSRRDLDLVPTTRLIDRNTGRPWPWSLKGEPDFVPARPALATDDPEAESAAVVEGAGIGQLARPLVNDLLAAGRLVELLPRLAPPAWPLSVYRVQREPVPRRVRLVFDALVAALQASSA
jgi:DNA-binding transcriptional LysR family regulator